MGSSQNLENMEKTGNVAVDMCIDCIQHNQDKKQPLKAIILNWTMFYIFQNWVLINYGKEMAEMQFCFGDIDIYKSINREAKIIQEVWHNE